MLLPVLMGPARGLRFRFDLRTRMEIAPFLGTHEQEETALAHCDRLIREKNLFILLELHNPECDAAAWEFSKRMGYSLSSVERGKPILSREEVHGTLLCTPLIR